MSHVKNIKIKNLSPNITDDKLKKMVPKTLIPKRMEFELHNINIGIANGIRRTLPSELLVKCMDFNFDKYSTNDVFMLNDFIKERIHNIPINQNVSYDSVFSLNVTNRTNKLMHVKSSEILLDGQKNKKLPFNGEFTLAILHPHKFLKITNIFIEEDYGYNGAWWSMACNSTCLPLDQTPIDLYTGEGISSSVSDPRKHKILFTSNGVLPMREIMIECCENIKERLTYVSSILDTLSFTLDEYILNVQGETDTIGNMLVKTISDLYPDITAVTYSTSPTSRDMKLKIRTNDNAEVIISDTIKFIIRIFDRIQIQFET